jgi:hypothetical protein
MTNRKEAPLNTIAHNLKSGSARRFARHYLEMVAAMVVGMVVLGSASEALLDLPDRTGVMLVAMAIWMTVPMVTWMRVRGHGWRASSEMAASMLVPTAAMLVLLGAGLVTDAGMLHVLEHVVMLPSMLVAMLLRREEYIGHHHGHAPVAA